MEQQTGTVGPVRMAEDIARRAHAGQVDKAGADYISHPARVAARLGADPAAQAVGWLHDVVEDTPVTLDDLRAAGFSPQIVAAVDAVTKRAGQDKAAYYARVAADPLALWVKFADLADNGDPERLARLDEATRARLIAKYATARAQLIAQAAAAGTPLPAGVGVLAGAGGDETATAPVVARA